MLPAKFQDHRTYGSGNYGNGGHLGHVTWKIYKTFVISDRSH